MGWKQDYERWRDMGHTWGPGIDDRKEKTAEELDAEKRSYDAYQQRLAAYRVPPRDKYRLAGQELKQNLPSHKDIILGNAPPGWREAYSSARLKLCKEAAETLGYTLTPMSESAKASCCFMVKVPHYATLPGRGGNIHPYAVSGIDNLEDCLQLVSDFSAIGQQVTTYFDLTFHYSCNDTGRLRMELESWSRSNVVSLPERNEHKEHRPLDIMLQNARDTTQPKQEQRFKYQRPPECDL